MATFTSYTSPFPTGKQKENLEARINLLSQMETPFYSGIGRGTTMTPSPQLIEESLNNVVNNAQVEGFDFPAQGSESPIVAGDERRTYSTQIFNKTVRVTGSQQANNTVSVTGKKELAEQLALRGMELKRDVEWACVGDKTSGDGSGNDNGVAVTPAQAAGYVYGGGIGAANTSGVGTAGRSITDYLGQTAFAVSAGGASGTGSTVSGPGAGLNRGTGSNHGTARPFGTNAESAINLVARRLYEQGGLSYNMGNAMIKNANVLLMSPANKVIFDTTLDDKSNTRRDIGGSGTIQGIEFTKYNSSFGGFMVMPDQFMADDFVAIYNPQNWKWVTYRPMHTQEIAKIGDSERRQLVMEGTLIHRHTRASGAVLALNTTR